MHTTAISPVSLSQTKTQSTWQWDDRDRKRQPAR